jgi:hypothetical protein
MNKKGDLSINIIVIAAIALLVLIILAVLILRTGGKLQTGTSCGNLGGACRESCDTALGEFPDSAGSCPTDQFCCRTLTSSPENPI